MTTRTYTIEEQRQAMKAWYLSQIKPETTEQRLRELARANGYAITTKNCVLSLNHPSGEGVSFHYHVPELRLSAVQDAIQWLQR